MRKLLVLFVISCLALPALAQTVTWNQNNTWKPVASLTWAPLVGLTWLPSVQCSWGTNSHLATLNWVYGQAATFNVYRNGVLIQSGIATTTWIDTTVQSGASYSYTVTAVVAGQESLQSTPVLVVIPSP